MDELERVELLAILDFFAAAPADAAEELDLAVLELDDAAAFSIGIDPKPLLFNRAIGLVESAQLRNVEQWFRSRGCPLAVSIVPGSGLESALVERNYQPGRTHMKFRRGIDEPPEREPTLRVERIGREHASAFGTVVATVFGAPKPMVRWLAALCGRDGWACFGAFDGDVLVGTGAAYIAGDYAWLGIATTLPDHRGRGSQSAILAARVRAGCPSPRGRDGRPGRRRRRGVVPEPRACRLRGGVPAAMVASAPRAAEGRMTDVALGLSAGVRSCDRTNLPESDPDSSPSDRNEQVC